MAILAAGLIGYGYVLWKDANQATTDNATSTTQTTKANTPAKDAAKTDALSANKIKATPKAENVIKEKNNQQIVDPNMPKSTISFEKKEHNYGKVPQETENEYIFKFTNSGTNPLLISKAKGSCGCTVPNYPKEPIMPGEDGEIQVVYSSRKSDGTQSKTVTIWANTVPEQTQLRITADVQKPQ